MIELTVAVFATLSIILLVGMGNVVAVTLERALNSPVDPTTLSVFVFTAAILLVASPAVVAIIAVFAFFGLIPARYRTVGVVTIIGAFLLNYLVGNAVLLVFAAQFPEFLEGVASARLAGLIEPVTTKFIPALMLLWYYADLSPETIRRLRGNPWLGGAMLGFAFGLLEALLKIAQPTGVYADVHALTPLTLTPAFLHLFTGFLVAGATFRWVGREPDPSKRQAVGAGVKIGVPLSVAMGVHYWWNAGGGFLVNSLRGFA